MSKNNEFEIPEALKELVEKNVDQAQEAYQKFLDATRKAQTTMMSSSEVISEGAKELHTQTIQFAEDNIEANFELANELLTAKDMQQALEIQRSFAEKQMKTYSEQAQKIAQLMSKTADKS